MKRPVTIHALLLSTALVAAYFVWTRDRKSGSDADLVPILNLSRVDEVHYDTPDRKVHIKRQQDKIGAHFWVDVVTHERPRGAFQGSRFGKRGRLKRRPRFGRKPPFGPRPVGLAKPPGPKPTTGAKPAVVAPPKAAAQPPKAGAKPAPKGAPASLKQDPKANPDAKKPAAKKPAAKKPAAKKPAAKKPPAHRLAPKKLPAKPATRKVEAKKPAAAKATPALPTTAPSSKPALAVKTPPPPPKKVRKEKFFKGNKAAAELFKLLARLPALRSLGRLGQVKLDEFGLSKSKSTLTIVSGSTRRTFTIGDRTYGNADYYLQDKADQRVYVIRSRPLEDLRYAEFRLMDRELVELKSADVEKVVLAAASKRKTLYQGNRHKPAAAFWSEEPNAKAGKDLYRTWLAKVLRLRALEYTRPGKAPRGLEELVRIQYVGRRGALGSLRLLVEQTLAPNTVSPAPKGAANYYAISDNTRVPVKLSKTLAGEIARDVDSVMKD